MSSGINPEVEALLRKAIARGGVSAERALFVYGVALDAAQQGRTCSIELIEGRVVIAFAPPQGESHSARASKRRKRAGT